MLAMSYYDILLDQQREFKALLERPYVPRRVVIPSGLDASMLRNQRPKSAKFGVC
jgi:hypothetical protein